ncbi:MAG TPA: tripartite tricarboxylate transporter substrate binding protein [Pseudolabrys sp.]|jgi:tripartite-type tricarboxylate transporter receptor subunit TctC|nr:tripartite tricarboxylate transporter substrate binding protein [Pseudolabrys sp.]
MILDRRELLHWGACAAALASSSGSAHAQSYPDRPVRIVIGFPPGGSSDIIGRLIAKFLSQRLGQTFILDNKPGAASNIATEMVVRAAPDGYTVLWVTSPNAINATLYQHLHFNFIRDMQPVVAVFRVPNVLEVNPSLPVKTVPELIAYAKANPGKLNFASSGVGSTAHLSGELFKAMTGVDMRHVPYRGSAPALVDLLSGQVQVMFDLLPASIGHIRADKLRALAVTSAARSDALPQIPTIAEFVPDYEASTFNGVGVPAGTPPAIVEALNKQINAALSDSTIKSRLADLGATGLGGSPAEFGKLVADETTKWARIIKSADIKID